MFSGQVNTASSLGEKHWVRQPISMEFQASALCFNQPHFRLLFFYLRTVHMLHQASLERCGLGRSMPDCLPTARHALVLCVQYTVSMPLSSHDLATICACVHVLLVLVCLSDLCMPAPILSLSCMCMQVPMFMASGLQVRFLRVVEPRLAYQTVKWVRYITSAGMSFSVFTQG